MHRRSKIKRQRPITLWLYGLGMLLIAGIFIVDLLRHGTYFPEMPLEPGMLLFVEDVSGGQGLSAGRFGDLVAYDPAADERYLLTADGHYIEDPAWGPEGRYVLFTSKRENRGGTRTLSETNRIYRLDLETRQIEPWGQDLPGRFGELSEYMQQPAISPDGNQMAFVTRPPDGAVTSQVVYYDVEADTIEVLIERTWRARGLVWSPDGTRLAVTAAEEERVTSERRGVFHGYVWDFAGGTIDTFRYDEETHTRLSPQDFLGDDVVLLRWTRSDLHADILLYEGDDMRLLYQAAHREGGQISDVTVHPDGSLFYRRVIPESVASDIMRYVPGDKESKVVLKADGRMRQGLGILRAPIDE